MCFRFLSESSLLSLISSLCILSDDSIQNKVLLLLLSCVYLFYLFRILVYSPYIVCMKLVLVILIE